MQFSKCTVPLVSRFVTRFNVRCRDLQNNTDTFLGFSGKNPTWSLGFIKNTPIRGACCGATRVLYQMLINIKY